MTTKEVLVVATDILIYAFIGSVILLFATLLLKKYIDDKDKAEFITVKKSITASDLIIMVYNRLPNCIVADVIISEVDCSLGISGVSFIVDFKNKHYIYFCSHVLNVRSVQLEELKNKRLASHPVCITVERKKIIDNILKDI